MGMPPDSLAFWGVEDSAPGTPFKATHYLAKSNLYKRIQIG
jgi:hypothetical protein